MLHTWRAVYGQPTIWQAVPMAMSVLTCSAAPFKVTCMAVLSLLTLAVTETTPEVRPSFTSVMRVSMAILMRVSPLSEMCMLPTTMAVQQWIVSKYTSSTPNILLTTKLILQRNNLQFITYLAAAMSLTIPRTKESGQHTQEALWCMSTTAKTPLKTSMAVVTQLTSVPT